MSEISMKGKYILTSCYLTYNYTTSFNFMAVTPVVLIKNKDRRLQDPSQSPSPSMPLLKGTKIYIPATKYSQG